MNIVDARKYNKLLSLIALLKIKTAMSARDVLKYRNVLWGPLAIFYSNIKQCYGTWCVFVDLLIPDIGQSTIFFQYTLLLWII